MTVNSQEQKRLLMDLDVNMRSGSCPYTVTFYGALFREVSFLQYFLDFMVKYRAIRTLQFG